MTWQKRLEDLLSRWPDRMAVVENVCFRRKDGSNRVKAYRPVLVISSHGLHGPLGRLLGRSEKNRLKRDVLNFFDPESLSFPGWEKATHMFVRHQQMIYDNGYYVLPGIFRWGDIPLSLYRFKKSGYLLPKSRRIETVLQLTPVESANFTAYVQNIGRNRTRVLGRYDHGGDQTSFGRLDDNHALTTGHNCSSWLSTAPIGAKGEPLIELIGLKRDEPIGTNPGWWYRTLLSQATTERVPVVLYWTPQPLALALEREVKPGESIAWDYLAR